MRACCPMIFMEDEFEIDTDDILNLTLAEIKKAGRLKK
jgi:hypothetical protein